MKASLPKRRIRAFSLVILSLLCFTFVGVSGQKPVKGAQTVQEVDGYRIKVVRFGGESYGYEIRKGPDVFFHQRRNPFTGSELGLKSREDAMKTATWLVQTVLKMEEMMPQNMRMPAALLTRRVIPKSVAHQLGIAIDK